MLEWTRSPCSEKLGIPCVSESSIAIVFLVAGKSIYAAIICSASASSLTLRDTSAVKVEAGLPLFWCP